MSYPTIHERFSWLNDKAVRSRLYRNKREKAAKIAALNKCAICECRTVKTLCVKCRSGLHQFGKSVQRMKKAIEYLEQSKLDQ